MARNLVDYTSQSNDPKYQVSASIDLGVPLEDVTVKEVVVGESLLNPSAHAVVRLQSAMYFRPTNWNAFRCEPITINIKDNTPGASRRMTINQHIYRCDNRNFTVTNTGNVEELSLHSVDQSILKDAETIMEKSWQCAPPSTVVKEAMSKLGVTQFTMNDSTGPARPYVAESIHPIQVIQQQANVALYNGNDPSFLHYMTIDGDAGLNVHKFLPLTQLMNENNNVYDIYGGDSGITGGIGFADQTENDRALRTAVTFNFPCDYDVLSDLLNGVNCDGMNMNDVKTFNLSSGSMSSVSGVMSQAANIFKSLTMAGTAEQQNSCETLVEKHLHTRQARMGMLERDKIALRITIPWTPSLHVGQQINFHWQNRYKEDYPQYGSGRYLILHMTHNIQYGGYAVTNLDCIANTFGTRD